VVHMLSADFKAATRIVTVFYKPPVKPDHVLIRVIYACINASDVNPLVESYICLPTYLLCSKLKHILTVVLRFRFLSQIGTLCYQNLHLSVDNFEDLMLPCR
jgi:hypothetical protein